MYLTYVITGYIVKTMYKKVKTIYNLKLME
jgi:hypothetical protein